MLIWRVENKKGRGCYIDAPYTRKILYKHMESRSHPNPISEKGIKRFPHPKEICGFLTKKKALKWFDTGELKELKKLGF